MRSAGVKNFKLFEERSDNVFEIQPDERMAPRMDGGAQAKRDWRGVTGTF